MTVSELLRVLVADGVPLIVDVAVDEPLLVPVVDGDQLIVDVAVGELVLVSVADGVPLIVLLDEKDEEGVAEIVIDELAVSERLDVRLLVMLRLGDLVPLGLRLIEALWLGLLVGVVVKLRFGVHETVGESVRVRDKVADAECVG